MYGSDLRPDLIDEEYEEYYSKCQQEARKLRAALDALNAARADNEFRNEEELRVLAEGIKQVEFVISLLERLTTNLLDYSPWILDELEEQRQAYLERRHE
jgi:hypothetical protein